MSTEQRNESKYDLAKVALYYQLSDVSSQTDKIICPLHDDINPSMRLDFKENYWFCFGCNQAGDALRLVCEIEKRYNKLSELEAGKLFVRILSNTSLSKSSIKFIRSKSRKIDNEDAIVQAQDYYYGLPTIDWLSDAQDFEEVFDAKAYMQGRGFNAKALSLGGAKITFNASYPIVFPILDNGDFKGRVSRTFSKKIEEKRKYLYNEGFSRASTLCGSYSKKSTPYIVEGYMDMLRLKSFGVKDVVAILGWKITDQQVEKLKSQQITKVISLLDNDTCGRKGTTHLRQHFNVIRMSYPFNLKDPGDISSKDIFDKMKQRTKQKLKKETE